MTADLLLFGLNSSDLLCLWVEHRSVYSPNNLLKQFLSLVNNQLTGLPVEINLLQNLQYLQLTGNPFKSISSTLYLFLERYKYGKSNEIKELVEKGRNQEKQKNKD